MKTLLWFGTWALVTALFNSKAQAENFYTPLLCPLEDAYLEVQNSSSEAQPFWFQNLGTSPFRETYVEVKAHGRPTLSLSDFYRAQETAVAIKSHTAALKFQIHCKGRAFVGDLDAAVSPWKRLAVSSQHGALTLHLANLSQQANSLEITFESSRGTVGSQTVSMGSAFSAKTISLQVPRDTLSLSMRAAGRWSGRIFSAAGSLLPLEEERVTLPSPVAGTRYFLFSAADGDRPDTFVVPMQNPKLIQESLHQMNHPEEARLLVARIEKSFAGMNRNFADGTPWSWQVVEAQNYADFAHISCDGSPQLVEERLNSWLAETGGTVCFWSYRVLRELSFQELQQKPLWSLPALPFPRHRH